MNRVLVTMLVASALLLTAALQSAFAVQPARVKETKIGKVLAGAEELTLYVFDKDNPGVSTCNGPCAENWTPEFAKDEDQPVGDYSVVTREDGAKQWAYKGQPLYGWAKDTEPEDTKGDGINGEWHAARP